MPKRSRNSTIIELDGNKKCSNEKTEDCDKESVLTDKNSNNETKKIKEISNNAINTKIDDTQDGTLEVAYKREKRQSAKVAQLAINSTPDVFKKQRLKINKMKGQELAKFVESSQKKLMQFRSVAEKYIKNANLKPKNCEKKDFSSSPESNGAVSLKFSSQQCHRVNQLPCENDRDKLYSSLENLVSEENHDDENFSSNSSLFSLDLNSYNKRIDLSDEENINERISIKKINDNNSHDCQPLKFDNVTLVVNSQSEIVNNKWIVLYLIEKIAEFHKKKICSGFSNESRLEITVYDIISNEDGVFESSKLELFLEKNFSNSESAVIVFVKEFQKAFENKLVISLVSSAWIFEEENLMQKDIPEYEIYEENLYEENNNLNDLKYICMGMSTYDNSLFCHYHFAFNKAVYFESPVIFPTEPLDETNYKNKLYKNSQIHTATHDTDAYNSTCNMFELFEIKNTFKYQPEELGFPSLHSSIIQPFLEDLLQPLQKVVKKISITFGKHEPDNKSICKKEYSSSHIISPKDVIINNIKSKISLTIDKILNTDLKISFVG